MSEREAIVAIEELVDALYASSTQTEQEANKEQVCQAEYEILAFTAKQLAETTKECVVIVKGAPSPDWIFDLKRAVMTLEKLKGRKCRRLKLTHFRSVSLQILSLVVFSDMQTCIRAQWEAQATNQQVLIIQKLSEFQHSIHLSLDDLALAFTPKQKQSAPGLDSIEEILRRFRVDLDAKLATLMELRGKGDEPSTSEQDQTTLESGNDDGVQAGEVSVAAEVEKVQPDFDDSLYTYVCDAHCHPHDDVDNLDAIARLRVAHVTIMGVREADWEVVKRVVEICRTAEARDEKEESRVGKAVPCFGGCIWILLLCIHPWYVHMVCSSSEPQPSDADYTHDARYSSILTSKISNDVAALIPTLPSPTPFATWSAQLRENLLSYPYALVGEVGLDRSARLLPPGAELWTGVIPTSVQCTQEHQLKILDAQLQMAWEMGRAASVHCVQAYGGLLELLRAKAKEWSSREQVGRKKRGGKAKKTRNDINDQSPLEDASSSALPPPPPPSVPAPRPPLRLCIHSYGGSVDMIRSLVSLPRAAVIPYFSFSMAINGRLGARLDELVCAVPEERLLIESDVNTPDKIDLRMRTICEKVAVAKGWSCEEVARRTGRNWAEFVMGEGINGGRRGEE
ncbi:hypothetical protein BC937DRAFT_94839 [Endogone sp. FLAS-F59071]|nr:hypothetical protein BC937DRAFT_94839 [Endogone sp. FLAS-F59071]|eukprot:RUS13745.1 hypothetical protein BC937DRAFT_94839 [Endogone sp. FLAS-F59071]